MRIYDLADRREGDSLLPYLSDSAASIRREAAIVFGSVQDAHALPQLTALLKDKSAEVVAAAAWAIGQTGDSSAAASLIDALQHSQGDAQVAIGEAVGKSGTTADIASVIDLLLTQKLPESANNAVMQAVYRGGLRKRVPAAAQAFALNMLTQEDEATQLYAAAFLGRVAESGPISKSSDLIVPMGNIKSPDVRQLLVRAFSRSKDVGSTQYLQSLVLDINIPALVRANAFRATGGYHDLQAQAKIVLQGNHEQVSVAAAEYLDQAYTGASKDLFDLARAVRTWRPRAILLKTTMRLAIQKGNAKEASTITLYIDSLFQKAPLYEQAALYTALGQAPAQHERLIAIAIKGEPVLATYAFEAYLGYYPKSVANNRPVIEAIMQVMRGGDPGLIAMGAEHVAAADLRFLGQITKPSFLDSTLNQLHLPEDIEAYNAVLKATAKVKGTEYIPHDLGYQHAIDWALVRRIPSGQTAEIVTHRGKVVLQLHVEDAPGTVANFVKLVQDGFYNGKRIHRMVPAFVAQGGCPRGDGWGSTPETIRSEWSALHYQAGVVGMASAGKDTESCQWFITHCSVPHLDGRYTIFAKVIEGLGVVQMLEIGDEIVSISLPGLSA